MENNPVGGAKFAFGNSKPADDKQTTETSNSPLEETVNNTFNNVIVETKEEEEDLDGEYTDVRSITISLTKNHSLYRKANDKVMPKRKDFIGASVTSSRILSSNKDEIEAYFPNLIGLAHNNPDFIMRIKQYLNNIRIGVDELGITFNTSFVYRHKKDYYNILKKEQSIESEYATVDRQNLHAVKAALKKKIEALNVLESSKHKFGYPINLEDYLMYRHCLLYNDVAKDPILVNTDPNIRFYFKDDAREAQKLAKYRMEVNKAKRAYVEVISDDILFNAIYVQYLVSNNQPVISGLAENEYDKQSKLDRFSAEEPAKFNKMVANKDAKLIGSIELLIANNILYRPAHNQNITDPEGNFIGSNMNEAVQWFKNPDNTATVNSYLLRLKNK